MAKVRTINSVYEEIKLIDPGTAITPRAIRRAVVEGDIPSKRIGKKYVVTLENTLAYFTGEITG